MGLDYEFMDMCDVLDEEHKQYRLQLKSIYKALCGLSTAMVSTL